MYKFLKDILTEKSCICVDWSETGHCSLKDKCIHLHPKLCNRWIKNKKCNSNCSLFHPKLNTRNKLCKDWEKFGFCKKHHYETCGYDHPKLCNEWKLTGNCSNIDNCTKFHPEEYYYMPGGYCIDNEEPCNNFIIASHGCTLNKMYRLPENVNLFYYTYPDSESVYNQAPNICCTEFHLCDDWTKGEKKFIDSRKGGEIYNDMFLSPMFGIKPDIYDCKGTFLSGQRQIVIEMSEQGLLLSDVIDKVITYNQTNSMFNAKHLNIHITACRTPCEMVKPELEADNIKCKHLSDLYGREECPNYLGDEQKCDCKCEWCSYLDDDNTNELIPCYHSDYWNCNEWEYKHSKKCQCKCSYCEYNRNN